MELCICVCVRVRWRGRDDDDVCKAMKFMPVWALAGSGQGRGCGVVCLVVVSVRACWWLAELGVRMKGWYMDRKEAAHDGRFGLRGCLFLPSFPHFLPKNKRHTMATNATWP
jgi:hypothetical protein